MSWGDTDGQGYLAVQLRDGTTRELRMSVTKDQTRRALI
jgi:hypothetical protein